MAAYAVNWTWARDFLEQGGFSLHRYAHKMVSAIRCDICGWIVDIDDWEMASGKSTRPICDMLKAHQCKPILVKDLMEDLEFAGKAI